MKHFLCILIIALMMSGPSLAAEPFRGIELHPDAPESVAKTFAESGVNTVVIPFLRQGDLNDPAFVRAVERWGKVCTRHRLRGLIAVRLFGPSEYTGSKGGYRTAIEGIALHSGVCPTDRRYWKDEVTGRIRRVAELARRHGLAGALFDYQATLCGIDYNTLYCYCDGCWDAFIQAGGKKNESLAGYNIGKRRAWMRSTTRGREYFNCLSAIVEEEMAKAAAAGRSRCLSRDYVGRLQLSGRVVLSGGLSGPG